MGYKSWTYNGGGTEEWRNEAGELHREDGPAHIEWDLNTGIAFFLAYYVKGRRHREDGPACVWRDPTTGQVTRSMYYVHGQVMWV